jgi:hypothetical protein
MGCADLTLQGWLFVIWVEEVDSLRDVRLRE